MTTQVQSMVENDVRRAEEFLRERPQGSTVKALTAGLGFRREYWERVIRKRLLDDSIADFTGAKASTRWFHHEHVPTTPEAPKRPKVDIAQVYGTIRDHGPLRAGKLAERLGVSPQSIGPLLQILRARSRIEKVGDEYRARLVRETRALATPPAVELAVASDPRAALTDQLLDALDVPTFAEVSDRDVATLVRLGFALAKVGG